MSVETTSWSTQGDQGRPVGRAGERVEENKTWRIQDKSRDGDSRET